MNSIFSDEPALPKKRINRYTWTQEQIDTLMSMASKFTRKGKRVRWREIAAATGHHESSCALKYHTIRSRAADLAERKRIDAEQARREKLKPPPVRAVPLPVRAPNPEFSRGGTTYKLLLDAEIRSRITDQGVTAGLLGDPPSGRSALDKKRLGIVDEYPLTEYRKAYERRIPKVTLPEVPFG